MQIFLMTLAAILLAFVGLSLGVIFGRAPIKGSCGGLACISGADCAGCPTRDDAADKS
ncbi:MAG: (Na+)-NQR maturation NqrM [Pararhodobacter sp.]|nr:(Na+)-NQR maturation NqrM [Pararhodobacter sp.]